MDSSQSAEMSGRTLIWQPKAKGWLAWPMYWREQRTCVSAFEGFDSQRYQLGFFTKDTSGSFTKHFGLFHSQAGQKAPRHSLTCPSVPGQPCIGPSTFTTTLLRRVYYYVYYLLEKEGAAAL